MTEELTSAEKQALKWQAVDSWLQRNRSDQNYRDTGIRRRFGSSLPAFMKGFVMSDAARYSLPGIDAMVTYMHDGLCRCGSRCQGWENDREAFITFLEDRWGSAFQANYWLEGVRDA